MSNKTQRRILVASTALALALAATSASAQVVPPSQIQTTVDGVNWTGDHTVTGAQLNTIFNQVIQTFTTWAAPAASPTFTGSMTYGGVTLAPSVTGTGSMALSTSPTFTGVVKGSNLDIEDTTTNLNVGINPQSFFSTTKTVSTAGVGLEAIVAQVTDTAGWTGVGAAGVNFVEAIRVGATLSNSSSLGIAEGVVAAVQDQTATSHTFLFGFEADIFNYTETAVSTSALNCSSACILSGGYISANGGPSNPGVKAADAMFMINPFPGTSLAQSGFLAAGNGLIFAAFADISTTANFGLDLAFATHNVGAIHIKDNEAIFWDTAGHASQLPALFLDASSNFTIGQGAASIALEANVKINGGLLSLTSSGGVGYGTGAGGVVAQATSKSTGVTLNTVTGAITLNAAALAAGAIVSFTLTDTSIAATDTLVLNHISGGTVGAYGLNAGAAAGSATISVRNATAGSLSEAIVIEFTVVKGATS